MHGCYNAYVVYGWREGDRDNSIEDDWLSDHGIEGFAGDIVREHAGEFVYGLECKLDKTTGLARIDAKAKRLVEAAYRLSGSSSTLQYHTAMRGDYNVNHDIYVPVSKRRSRRLSGDGPTSPLAEKRHKTDNDDSGDSS